MRAVSLALVAVAGLLAAPTLCHAVPINYTISGTTTLNGDVETITGSFTADAGPTLGSSSESNVSITLTGAAPFAGTYSQTAVAPQFATNTVDAPATGTPNIELVFRNVLNVSPDELDFIVYQEAARTFFIDNSPQGSATLVPEPASLTLLGTALAGFGLIRRRRRKDV